MKGPATGVNFNQTTLIGKKNKVQQSFLISKIKNVPQASKLAAKKPPQELLLRQPLGEENIKTLKKETSGILPNSKKIQKTAPNLELSRLALKSLSDFCNNKTPSPVVQKTLPLPKVFIEDGIKKTRNYVALTYLNSRTRKVKQFYCFHDRDLKVPAAYSTKTIEHSCDNDCSTDEDQIKGGIRNLYKALESHLLEEKK